MGKRGMVVKSVSRGCGLGFLGVLAGLSGVVSPAVAANSRVEKSATEACPQPKAGDEVTQPPEIASVQGTLRVRLRMRSDVDANGRRRYCYITDDGKMSPTLRLKPGDTLIAELKNEVTRTDTGKNSSAANVSTKPNHSGMDHSAVSERVGGSGDPCAGGLMIEGATNLHFHGMVIPPTCHQDETLRTLIAPGAAPFEYRIHIPEDTPPGLYWYHPHPHGFSKAQVLGGACGALIIEGMEAAEPAVRGLHQEVLILRDQELVHPNAEPVRTDAMPAPIVLRDAEGDILNTGSDGGKPAKDLSVNNVPVPFPEYSPAKLTVKAADSQFWRVLNASAITYADLQLLFDNRPQMLGVVALDGVPLNVQHPESPRVVWYSHITLPPGARAEFAMKTPPVGMKASFVTRMVDTGPAGENDPTRPLITLVASKDGEAEPVRAATDALHQSTAAANQAGHKAWLGDVKPVRERKLYFYEEPENPKDPNSPTKFYITIDGQPDRVFDMSARSPNMTVNQGTVEDWTIENRTRELHAFHIHQTHFLLTEWNGVPLQEPFLRDIVNVPYWDGVTPVFPSVKLRMDFRDPSIVGTFMYHCHLLEHEDGGMMGTIRVGAATSSRTR